VISSRLGYHVPEFDGIIHEDAADFGWSGLMTAGLNRVGRLSVVDESIPGIQSARSLPMRLKRIKSGLADWLLSGQCTNCW
jgi:hypothetical protein